MFFPPGPLGVGNNNPKCPQTIIETKIPRQNPPIRLCITGKFRGESTALVEPLCRIPNIFHPIFDKVNSTSIALGFPSALSLHLRKPSMRTSTIPEIRTPWGTMTAWRCSLCMRYKEVRWANTTVLYFRGSSVDFVHKAIVNPIKMPAIISSILYMRPVFMGRATVRSQPPAI